MTSLARILILYNPNSTGPAKTLAKELQQTLQAQSSIDCALIKTEHEGHAIELGKQHASAGTMIISSSGDGGFHELVNGVMSSDHASQTMVGVLPAGNANDHYTARHHGDIAERIIAGDAETMDLLRITWGNKTLYAHSYAGLGMTADIGKTLTDKRPSLFAAPWIVLAGLIKRHSVRVVINGKNRRYDSFVVNLIGKMSKVLATGERDRSADGTFDLAIQRHTSLAQLLRHLLRRVITDDIKDAASLQSLAFTTRHVTAIQLDGEVYTIPRSTSVTIDCLPNALRCII